MKLRPTALRSPDTAPRARLPPLRVGVGGPVGSGKTTLVEMLCKAMRERWDLVVVTNDIYTKEDQRLLTVAGALAPERIMGVETGGCPHTAIREDASINLEAVDRMLEKFPDADIVFIESGGDNLAATFSPELSDLTIYVIDVAAGEKIPRKGGPGITKSDLFVINKTDLAPHVGADLSVMEADTRRMRPTRPYVMTNLKTPSRPGRRGVVHRDPRPAAGGLSPPRRSASGQRQLLDPVEPHHLHAGRRKHVARAILAAGAVARDAGFVLQLVEIVRARLHRPLDVAVGDAVAEADDHGARSKLTAPV